MVNPEVRGFLDIDLQFHTDATPKVYLQMNCVSLARKIDRQTDRCRDIMNLGRIYSDIFRFYVHACIYIYIFVYTCIVPAIVMLTSIDLGMLLGAPRIAILPIVPGIANTNSSGVIIYPSLHHKKISILI